MVGVVIVTLHEEELLYLVHNKYPHVIEVSELKDSDASNSAIPKKMKRTLLDLFDSSSSSSQTKKLKPENDADAFTTFDAVGTPVVLAGRSPG